MALRTGPAIAAALFCWSAISTRAADPPADPPPDPEAFRALLAAKDAPLESARLQVECVQWSEEKAWIPDESRGVRGGWSVPTARAIMKTYLRTATFAPGRMRIRHAPLELAGATAGPATAATADAGLVTAEVKPGTASDEVEVSSGVLTVAEFDGKPLVDQREGDTARNALRGDLRDTLLGLGVGLGGALTRIDSLERADGGGYRLTGAAKYFGEDFEEVVEAELDADLVIRTCRLTVAWPGEEQVCAYQSQGTVEAAGMTLAEQGSFVWRSRILRPSFAGGERTWSDWKTLAADGYKFRELELDAVAGRAAADRRDGPG